MPKAKTLDLLTPDAAPQTYQVWRADTGYLNERNATAWDVVLYEREALGNHNHIDPAWEAPLRALSARQIAWYAPTQRVARRYGYPEPYAIEGWAIGYDDDGGYLIVRKPHA